MCTKNSTLLCNTSYHIMTAMPNMMNIEAIILLSKWWCMQVSFSSRHENSVQCITLWEIDDNILPYGVVKAMYSWEV